KTCASMAVSEREKEEDCKEQPPAYYGKKTCASMAVSEREEEEDCKEQPPAYYGKKKGKKKKTAKNNNMHTMGRRFKGLGRLKKASRTRRLEDTKINRLGGNMLEKSNPLIFVKGAEKNSSLLA
ncbi:hypothetical protein Tco_1100969, partial [Tanacetum coccineum]